MSASSKVIGVAGGVALAGVSEVALAKFAPQHRTPVFGVGLGVVAAVYPLARSQRPRSAPVVREMTALAAFGVVGALTARSASSAAGRVVAAGWAGYDLGVTAILLRPSTHASEGWTGGR